jgi:23S rRNA maturation-related 3'-5' exoribonuclease YhaM
LEGGVILNLTAKELMHLEDYLTSEKSREKTLTFYVEQIEDQQIKTILQQMTQKSKGNFQRMAKYVSGQNLQ